jgi:hypothetical protein
MSHFIFFQRRVGKTRRSVDLIELAYGIELKNVCVNISFGQEYNNYYWLTYDVRTYMVWQGQILEGTGRAMPPPPIFLKISIHVKNL